MADYTLSHTGAELDEAIEKVLNGYEPAIAAVEQATPVITVGTDGLITASATQEDGHVPAGTKTSTKQLTTQAAKTVTPSTSEQTAVASGVYTTGTVKVASVPTETKSITSNGTYTPTSGKFFSSVNVNVPSQSINTQTKSVTPSESQQTVSPDSGYDGLSSVTVGAISSTYVGSGVTRKGAATYTPGTSAQTISSGQYLTGNQTISAVPTETKDISANGTYTPTSGKFFSSVTVNVPTSGGLPSSIVAGDTPVLSSSKLAYTCTATSMTATGISVSITKAGTYRFKFSCGRTNTSGTWTTQLYKNGSAVSGATVTWSSYQGTCTADIACSAGDTIEIYARSRSTSYRNIVGQLVACIDWDNGI